MRILSLCTVAAMLILPISSGYSKESKKKHIGGVKYEEVRVNKTHANSTKKSPASGAQQPKARH